MFLKTSLYYHKAIAGYLESIYVKVKLRFILKS